MVRFDSLSKILSAGMRMGFVSGPTSILNAMDMHVRLLPARPDSGLWF